MTQPPFPPDSFCPHEQGFRRGKVHSEEIRLRADLKQAASSIFRDLNDRRAKRVRFCKRVHFFASGIEFISIIAPNYNENPESVYLKHTPSLLTENVGFFNSYQ